MTSNEGRGEEGRGELVGCLATGMDELANAHFLTLFYFPQCIYILQVYIEVLFF